MKAPAHAPAGTAIQSDEEVAGRLRVAVNRLQRRLRREALGGLSPGQASALGTVRPMKQTDVDEMLPRFIERHDNRVRNMWRTLTTEMGNR